MHDPLIIFAQWLEKARQTPAIAEPTAMCLATVSDDYQPSARMVLLKGFDARGFVFYTNLHSRKSRELKAHAKAALCFHWMPLERQLRIEGTVEPVSAPEADAYFASRARESQIGAWSSKQSQPMESTDDLRHAIAAYDEQFMGTAVPRPDFWSGWRVAPQRIEFWQQGDFRLHERIVYVRAGDGWETQRLYP